MLNDMTSPEGIDFDSLTTMHGLYQRMSNLTIY